MKKIKLSRGKTALIDDDDFERVSQYNWYINENAEKTKLYAMRSKLKSEEGTVKGTKVYMHRFILQVVEKSAVIQHKNGNTLDNRKENLAIKKRAISKKNKIVLFYFASTRYYSEVILQLDQSMSETVRLSLIVYNFHE